MSLPLCCRLLLCARDLHEPCCGVLRAQDAAVRGSVQLVQIKGPNTEWQSMSNVWGASWELGQSPQPPLDIRIVDDEGEEVRMLRWPCGGPALQPCVLLSLPLSSIQAR